MMKISGKPQETGLLQHVTVLLKLIQSSVPDSESADSHEKLQQQITKYCFKFVLNTILEAHLEHKSSILSVQT